VPSRDALEPVGGTPHVRVERIGIGIAEPAVFLAEPDAPARIPAASRRRRFRDP
jgi:hypothetical protein